MRHVVSVAIVLAILVFQGCSKKDQSNETNTTQTIDPALQTLTLSIGNNELPENNETTVTLTAADGKDITTADSIVWHFSDANVTELNGTKLIAKKEGTTTIQAEYNGKYSQEQNVTVYKIIHGHRLPPEPDPKINNSTLLGIDSNHNGVRDDVERWIYETYKDKHPIYIDIAMQAGRVSNKILANPLMDHQTAKDIHKEEIAVVACEAYYKYDAKYFGEPILVEEDISTGYFEKLYFDTDDRKNIYNQYAELLSGESYALPKSQERKALCDFNTSKF